MVGAKELLTLSGNVLILERLDDEDELLVNCGDVLL